MSNTPVLSAISSLRSDFPSAGLGNREADLARWHTFRKSLDTESQAFLYCKFLENFCDQQNYRIPTKRNTAGNNEFFKEVSLSDFAPEDLVQLVNPKRIKVAFLKNIGVDFKLDQENKLVVDSSLVSDLVNFFERLQPLKFELKNADYKLFTSSPRYFVVTAPKSEVAGSNKATGNVLRFTSAYDEIEEDVVKKEFSITIIKDLATCLRGRFLERGSSEREIDRTIPLASESDLLSRQFWNWPTTRAEDQELMLLSTKELGEAASKFMKAPQVPEKVKAKNAITTGKLDKNPPARALQLDGAQRNLSKRVQQVSSISAVNEKDILYLRTVYLKSKQVFESAEQRAERKSLAELAASKYAFFNTRHTTTYRLNQLDNFLVGLGFVPEILQRFNFKPFKTFADTILEWRKKTQEIINSGELNGIQQHMQDLSVHIRLAASVYSDYLTARHVMNGENPLVDGKARMLDYIKKLKQTIVEGYFSSQAEEVTDFLARVDKVENKLLRFEPPKNLKPITHLKNLSAQVDLEVFLSKLLVKPSV